MNHKSFYVYAFWFSILGFNLLSLSNLGISASRIVLKEVLFTVDGIPNSVKNNQVFDISYGSVLVLKKSTLSESFKRESSMNFIGFRNGSIKRPYDDRNFPIEIWKQSNKWAIKKTKNATIYSTKVYYRSKLVGEVFFRLLHPKFEYLEISINGVPKVIRKETNLTLNRADQIKFGSVKLTPDFLEPKQLDIDFDIKPKGKKPDSKSDQLNIKISHNGRTVGNIPVTLQ